MNPNFVGKALLLPGPCGKPVIVGRIILVSEIDDLVFVAGIPRIKKNGHIDNYVATPRVQSLSELKHKLDKDHGYRLADFEPPAHWLWSDAQLRGHGNDGSGRRQRRNVKSWVAKANKAYNLIDPFVGGRSIEEILYDPALRSWPAARSRELRVREVAVRRALNAYLLGMGNKRALLPWYVNSGAPGQQKFSKVDTGRPDIAAEMLGKKRHRPHLCKWTRAQLALGWKKHKKPGVSVEIALQRTLAGCMAKKVVWNGKDCEVVLEPEAADITPAMFRYWGTHEAGALTAIQINRGETAAKKEYVRRLGKMKGRHSTANGIAFLDSTSADQTLRSVASSLTVLSSPWRTEVLGGGIDYIFGIYVGFEAPSATTALLSILNAAEDKVAYCARFGHEIEARDWYAFTFSKFLLDNGEAKGQVAMRTLEELESSASYGAAYDPISKAPVESSHRSKQAKLDHLLPGSTMGRRKRRGEPDRSQMARLTFDDYMHLLIKEILWRNNQEHIDPPRIEMYEGLQERTRRGVLEWMMKHHYVSSSATDLSVLRAACLPRLRASMHGDGLHIFNPAKAEEHLIPELVYRSQWLDDAGILQRAASRRHRLEVHLNPADLSHVWVNIGGLKRLELVTNDPDLHKLCLTDWLAICADNRLRGYLAKALEVGSKINKVATIDKTTRARDAERREEIKNADKKPTKNGLRAGRRGNTVIETAALTGVPKPLPASQEVKVENAAPSPGLPPPAPPVGCGDDALIARAKAIYEARAS
ncbi:hypothetical protein [Roseateles flavus]|uniref:Integrase catalytic domain-containing protein n=1 Tax=Roseateles flavus TaxID=3149041 RepID=A0ABV0GK60_9BURK